MQQTSGYFFLAGILPFVTSYPSNIPVPMLTGMKVPFGGQSAEIHQSLKNVFYDPAISLIEIKWFRFPEIKELMYKNGTFII